MNLKKRLYVIIALICSLSFLFGTMQPAMASSTKSRVIGFIDANSNRTYVPIRYVTEQLGASVKWTPINQSINIRRGSSEIQLIVGHKEAIVDGSTVTIDDVPILLSGVTFVPIRFITDVFQVDIEWSKSTSTVYVHVGDAIHKIPLVTLGTDPAKMQPLVRSSKTFTIANRKFNTTMLTINLLHPSVDLDIGIARNKIGNVDDLKNMAIADQASAAINGTFFDAYTEDSYKAAYGYIVKDYEIVNKASGDLRTILVFDKDNNVEFVHGEDFLQRYEDGDIKSALQVGPRLITDGMISINVEAEGFRDPKILTGGGARSAVGITRDHRMIILTVPGATIPQLAEIMLAAGAYHAMNLDGGASSGLYYDGEYLTRTGRQISNALLIKVD